jgi:hypothetical protein
MTGHRRRFGTEAPSYSPCVLEMQTTTASHPNSISGAGEEAKTPRDTAPQSEALVDLI